MNHAFFIIAVIISSMMTIATVLAIYDKPISKFGRLTAIARGEQFFICVQRDHEKDRHCVRLNEVEPQ